MAEYCTSSSDRIAAEFMSQGRPSPGSTPESCQDSLPINPQVPGKDFVSWAVEGYKLDGGIKTEGTSDHMVHVPVVPKK